MIRSDDPGDEHEVMAWDELGEGAYVRRTNSSWVTFPWSELPPDKALAKAGRPVNG